jgi:hypothetical protein
MVSLGSAAFQSIDDAVLTAIVRQSLRRDTFHVLDWQVSQLGGGAGNPVSVGLYRFEGTGQDRDELLTWSVILKIIQSPANVGWENMGEGDDPAHWNYWKREALLYPSGLLEKMPEGLAAPRCYGVSERQGNITWLWLEDIADAYGDVWPLERYVLAARHLGRLNGMVVPERSLPDFPWLSRHRTRQWIASLPWRTIPWDHPRVLARYPRPEVNTFRRMLLENERFLARLDLLPTTICHGDTYPTNFKSRPLTNGQQETVALDWALAGLAPVGDDLGQFVFGAQKNLEDTRREDIDQALFESYLDGLRDSGCRVDAQQVRFGYCVSAALRVGLFQLFLLNEELKHSTAITEQAVERPAVPDCFEVAMANEAYELLTVIG